MEEMAAVSVRNRDGFLCWSNSDYEDNWQRLLVSQLYHYTDFSFHRRQPLGLPHRQIPAQDNLGLGLLRVVIHTWAQFDGGRVVAPAIAFFVDDDLVYTGGFRNNLRVSVQKLPEVDSGPHITARSCDNAADGARRTFRGKD